MTWAPDVVISLSSFYGPHSIYSVSSEVPYPQTLSQGRENGEVNANQATLRKGRYTMFTHGALPPPRSLVVRASAGVAGGRGSIPDHVTSKT